MDQTNGIFGGYPRQRHLRGLGTLAVLLAAAIILQSFFLDKRYGERVIAPECPWCDARSSGREDVLYLPVDTRIMKLFSPADPHFLADLLWMRTCYYFGEHALTNRQYPYLLHLLDAITDLSPKWVQPFIFGAVILPTEADAVEDGMYLIDKGLAFHPNNWQLWFFKGYYHWKTYEDYAAAAEALHRAAISPNAPLFLTHLSASFATQAGRREFAVQFLREAMNNLNDPQQKRALERKIQEILKNG